jgi:CRP-like cAMP-binding protein
MPASRTASRFSGRNRLLAALPPEELSVVAPHLQSVALAQGELLQEQEEPIESVYFPNSGVISLQVVMKAGTAVGAAAVGRAGIVGALLGTDARRAFGRAVVQVEGNADRMAATDFRRLLAKTPALRDLVARYHEVLVAQLLRLAACNAVHEVEQRLSRWLLQTRDRTGTDAFPATQESLSQLLGVRRTTVTEIANSLQQEGVLRYNRGYIEILDSRRLEKIACECYGAMRAHLEELSAGKNEKM